MPATEPSTIEDVREGLQGAGYLAGESAALVAYLATRLGKPVLVEGPAGVGKTELAKALSRYLGRPLVRLQCYEGLDEAKALYEWNYRKQLLRIQAEAQDTGWSEVQDDIFGEEFLLTRPLLQAISSEEPVVLLIARSTRPTRSSRRCCSSCERAIPALASPSSVSTRPRRSPGRAADLPTTRAS